MRFALRGDVLPFGAESRGTHLEAQPIVLLESESFRRNQQLSHPLVGFYVELADAIYGIA